MKQLSFLFIFLTFYSCDFGSSGKMDKQLNQDLSSVADSISNLISAYHYNPKELSTNAYLKLKDEVRSLAENVETEEEFVNGFNKLWSEGPFSHVRLAMAEIPAEEMANFIDTLRVGDQSV